MNLPAGLQAPSGGTRVAAFGLRVLDTASGRPVRDGLQVQLFPQGRPEWRRDAFATTGGVYALVRAPGLGAFDRGDGQRAFWADALAQPVPYTVEVRDTLGRFHDVALATTLPSPGPFGSGADASGLPPAVALPSAPARSAPPAAAVVRAELCDARAPQRPLRHALLRVACNGVELGTGVADLQGRVAVMFQHPELAFGSAFEWPLTLRVHCARPDTGYADPTRPSPLPDLAQLLAQASGTEWRAQQSWNEALASGTELAGATLCLGRELVLKTAGWSRLLAVPA